MNLINALVTTRNSTTRYVDIATNPYNQKFSLLVADYLWWSEHEDAIKEWAIATNNSLQLQGMILEFESQEDKMMFLLRW